MKSLFDFIGQIIEAIIIGILGFFTLYCVFFPITIPLTLLLILIVLLI